MGLLTSLLTLPITGPIKTALWISEKIHDEALAKINDPAAIKAEIVALEKMLLAGEISEEDYEAAELALLTRLRDIQRAAKVRR